MDNLDNLKDFQQYCQFIASAAPFDLYNRTMRVNKYRNNDSGFGHLPRSLKFLDKQKESFPSCSGQSLTIKSTQPSDSEKFQTLTEAFRKRGDVDHVFADPVKCILCDFKAVTLFHCYHHIIEHCKRTDDSDFETDSTQIEMENTESLYNEDDCLAETSNKKRKRRKTIKPKRCKFRNCNFVTIEKLDIMEAKKELWKHMRENHKYPLVCPLCPFVTEPKHHMVYHWLGDHTDIRPFKCEELHCTYTCVAKSMLNSHVVRHWDYYQYNCEECSFKARLLHAMKKHMREKNHSRVKILNKDGTQSQKTIDIYSNKRGPRRKIPVKIQDEPDQSDLTQSSSPEPFPPEPFPECPELDSHSEPQPQQQSQTVETNSNIKNNKNENLIYSETLQWLYVLSKIISDSIARWNKGEEDMFSWNYLYSIFCNLLKKNVSAYNTEAYLNRLESLYVMKILVDENIRNLSKTYNMAHDNSETSSNNEAGPSNENANNINTINESSICELEYQLKTQYISTKDNVNFEIANSEVDPADDKKDIDRVSTSRKRKIESERFDDTATTSNNFYLTNNKADACNTISYKIPTFMEESQPQNIIPNKPLNIFKLTGATKRKCKTQTRLKVETNTERNKTESFESLKNIQCILPKESQFNLIINNENLNYCKHCDIKYGDKMLHVMHMHFHKIDDPFVCNECGEKYANSLTFYQHLISTKHLNITNTIKRLFN